MRYCRDTGPSRPVVPAREPSRGAPAIAVLAAVSLVSCLLSMGPAAARDVTFPKDEPKVVMDVPDGLTVVYTAFGLEITSPDKRLYIVADVLPRNKTEADGWARKAVAKMQTFGVRFDDAGARSAAEKPRRPAEPAAAAAAPPNASAAAIDRSAPTFTFMSPMVSPARPAAASDEPAPVFSGSPSIGTPSKPNVTLAVRTDVPAGASLEEMAVPGLKGRPSKLPFHVGHFSNTTLHGQHVDVEIVDFGLSAKQLFLVLQASLSGDDRAAEIMKSVKPTS